MEKCEWKTIKRCSIYEVWFAGLELDLDLGVSLRTTMHNSNSTKPLQHHYKFWYSEFCAQHNPQWYNLLLLIINVYEVCKKMTYYESAKSLGFQVKNLERFLKSVATSQQQRCTIYKACEDILFASLYKILVEPNVCVERISNRKQTWT